MGVEWQEANTQAHHLQNQCCKHQLQYAATCFLSCISACAHPIFVVDLATSATCVTGQKLGCSAAAFFFFADPGPGPVAWPRAAVFWQGGGSSRVANPRRCQDGKLKGAGPAARVLRDGNDADAATDCEPCKQGQGPAAAAVERDGTCSLDIHLVISGICMCIFTLGNKYVMDEPHCPCHGTCSIASF